MMNHNIQCIVQPSVKPMPCRNVSLCLAFGSGKGSKLSVIGKLEMLLWNMSKVITI